jgi:general secretion pathway protein J
MRADQRGFTLIEVLLAIFIGSLLLTSVYGIFSSVSNAKNRLESEGESYHQVRIFFDRIGGELSSLRLIPVKQQAVLQSDRTLEGEPALEFTTELVSPLLQQKGGVSRVRYELRRNDETAALYRSEQVLLADFAPSEALPFIEQLVDFQVRYYQNGQWQEQWPAGQPPEMLEITLEVAAGEQTIPFRSSFVLPGAGG